MSVHCFEQFKKLIRRGQFSGRRRQTHREMVEKRGLSQVKKCPKCWVLQQYCFCSRVERVRTRHEILLFIHANEMINKSCTNTAKLIPLCLGGRTYVFGDMDDELKLHRYLCRQPKEHVFFLFPSNDAIDVSVLKRPSAGSEPRYTIVVLDGSWSNVKTINSHGLFKKFSRIKLNGVSRLRHENMRKHSVETHLSTMSATIGLLRELEVDTEAVCALEKSLENAVSAFRRQAGKTKKIPSVLE